jgi:cell division protease FtsH
VKGIAVPRRIVHHTAPAKPPDPRASQKQKGPAPPPPPEWRRWLLYLGVAATILLFFLPIGQTSSTELSYTQFVNDVTANKVKTATIDSNGGVSGTLTDGTVYRTQIPVALQDANLSTLLQQHNVQITGEGPSSSTFLAILVNLLPFIMLFGVFWYVGRRAQRQAGGGGFLGLAGSPAPGQSCGTKSGPRQISPTSLATRAPSRRSTRSSISSSTPSAIGGSGPAALEACSWWGRRAPARR